ncbi:MAG TPA: UPF0149 family protein [Rhodanobacteraceae bacterium]
MDASITYADLTAARAQTLVTTSASELHGLVIGYVCGGGRAHGVHLLQALQLDSDDIAVDSILAGQLEHVRADTDRQLVELHPAIEPLLPPDARPVAERADAMIDWTRGFLGGFGLAGAGDVELSADGREVLNDLGDIAASTLTVAGPDESAGEDDESALMELTEFVRIGGLLLHAEVAVAARVRGERH